MVSKLTIHDINQGLYSLSGKTSYRKISWSLKAARFGFKLFQSLWNLTCTSAARLPRCLSNVRAIRPLQHPISRLRDFTRFGGKTSYRLVNRGSAMALLLTHILQWRHNGHNDVSNHQLHDCLLNRLFRHRSKKTSKPHVTDRWLPRTKGQ